MEFEVKTVLGAEAIMAYQKINGKTVERRNVTRIRAGLIAVGVLGLTGSAVAIGAAGFTGAVAFGVILSMACFALGLCWYQYAAWRVARRVPEGFTQEFYFGENGVVGKSSGEQIFHNYSDFIALAEAQDYFCLFLNNKLGYVLPKKGFFRGTPEAFGDFIKKMTGKDLPLVNI